MASEIKCPNCGSTKLEWATSTINTSMADHGRLFTGDMSVVFSLGCCDCSETLRIVQAESNEGHQMLNASDHLAAVGEMQKQIDALRAECREHRTVMRFEGQIFDTDDMKRTNAALGGEP